ncbi:hypothetical protein AB0M79_28100 [Polymorphospora sp. NPDC051019]|uniref:hypothetical protein n=1 Tax=Polymorphospora sp. NPDC051019 TaxID=3155725 RepID=UPI00342CFD63
MRGDEPPDELIRATPTSVRTVLLARLTLVLGAGVRVVDSYDAERRPIAQATADESHRRLVEAVTATAPAPRPSPTPARASSSGI